MGHIQPYESVADSDNFFSIPDSLSNQFSEFGDCLNEQIQKSASSNASKFARALFTKLDSLLSRGQWINACQQTLRVPEDIKHCFDKIPAAADRDAFLRSRHAELASLADRTAKELKDIFAQVFAESSSDDNSLAYSMSGRSITHGAPDSAWSTIAKTLSCSLLSCFCVPVDLRSDYAGTAATASYNAANNYTSCFPVWVRPKPLRDGYQTYEIHISLPEQVPTGDLKRRIQSNIAQWLRDNPA